MGTAFSKKWNNFFNIDTRMKITPKDNELYVVRGHRKDEDKILRMDNATWLNDGVHSTENFVKTYYNQVSKFKNFLWS